MDTAGYGSIHVLVAQMGARMHYAVPRILHEAGLLERLYTDICAVKGWPRFARCVIPARWQPVGLKSLSHRAPRGIPAGKITAFTKFGLEYARRRRRASTESEMTDVHLWAGRTFCDLIIARGLGEASAVYAFNSAGFELLCYTSRQGLSGTMEQTIAPRSLEMRLLKEEEDRFPGWEPKAEDNTRAGRFVERERAEWDVADRIVCGSEFVRDGIRREGGPADKAVVVPYGVDPASDAETATLPGNGPLRALFAGTVGLRKGVGDLARAAEKVGKKVVSVRAVGSIALSDLGRKEVARNVKLLGRIPGSQMAAEYANADVFVLPSICEGSATVSYEALGAGLPVITTPNAGTVVRDGVDGYIVPVRSPERIAEKLERLAFDRELLNHLSKNARERAKEFTVNRYRDRLVKALAGSG